VLGTRTLLDGAMGTALLARGLAPGALPEEWLLARPEEISRVHAAHAAAGARVLLTCTFSCAAPRLETRLGAGRSATLCEHAARLAREAAPPGALVAGAVGPTGLAGPGTAPISPARLAARYEPSLAALAAAGVDLLWLESHWDLSEALAALGAARATGVAAVVSFTPAERDGALRLADGTPAEDALLAAAGAGAAAAGVNCLFAGDALTALAAWAARHLPVPFVVKPSPGLPGAVLAPGAFAEALRPAVAAGARAVGGCCGATADHLRALAPLVAAP
jgi:5-methyltetrahydrofolate--homocysteine methyltransferase